MELLATIIALSVIMWYLIDRFKPLWETVERSKYITIIVACVLACMLEAISIDASTRTKSNLTQIRAVWACLLYSKAYQAIIDNRITQS